MRGKIIIFKYNTYMKITRPECYVTVKKHSSQDVIKDNVYVYRMWGLVPIYVGLPWHY